MAPAATDVPMMFALLKFFQSVHGRVHEPTRSALNTISYSLVPLWWTPPKGENGVHGEEKRARRKFTDEFKSRAVDLVLKQGLSVSQTARDLGINESKSEQLGQTGED